MGLTHTRFSKHRLHLFLNLNRLFFVPSYAAVSSRSTTRYFCEYTKISLRNFSLKPSPINVKQSHASLRVASSMVLFMSTNLSHLASTGTIMALVPTPNNRQSNRFLVQVSRNLTHVSQNMNHATPIH